VSQAHPDMLSQQVTMIIPAPPVLHAESARNQLHHHIGVECSNTIYMSVWREKQATPWRGNHEKTS
jgi:hypothetical protein